MNVERKKREEEKKRIKGYRVPFFFSFSFPSLTFSVLLNPSFFFFFTSLFIASAFLPISLVADLCQAVSETGDCRRVGKNRCEAMLFLTTARRFSYNRSR